MDYQIRSPRKPATLLRQAEREQEEEKSQQQSQEMAASNQAQYDLARFSR
jgi:hypothetical protein